MARAVIVPRVSPYVAKLERTRRAIPIEKYLKLLDIGASTGFIPQLDPNGRPTGNFDQVKVMDRIAILKSLVDKALPSRQETPALPEDIEAERRTIDVSKLDDKELEDILAADTASPAVLAGTPIGNDDPEPASAAVSDGPGSPGTAEEEGEDGA